MESFDLQEELQGLTDVASYSFDNETDVSALDASSIAHDVLEPAVSALAQGEEGRRRETCYEVRESSCGPCKR